MFFEKVECLASTYKSGGLICKLPKKTIYIYIYIYIREFISYLNQLLNNNDDDDDDDDDCRVKGPNHMLGLGS